MDWSAVVDHPLFVGTALLVIGLVVEGGRRMLRDIGAMRRDVSVIAPHFTPPEPGQPDVSVPGRLGALEKDSRDLRTDLVEHMRDERTSRDEDRREMREAVQRLHDRIDEALGRR